MLPEEVWRRCVSGKVVYRDSSRTYVSALPNSNLGQEWRQYQVRPEIRVDANDLAEHVLLVLAIPVHDTKCFVMKKYVYAGELWLQKVDVYVKSTESQPWELAPNRAWCGQCSVGTDGFVVAYYHDDIGETAYLFAFGLH